MQYLFKNKYRKIKPHPRKNYTSLNLFCCFILEMIKDPITGISSNQTNSLSVNPARRGTAPTNLDAGYSNLQIESYEE